MTISGTSAAASAQNASNGDAVAISVQKKSQDIEKERAAGLLQALPDPMSSLGHNINVKV